MEMKKQRKIKLIKYIHIFLYIYCFSFILFSAIVISLANFFPQYEEIFIFNKIITYLTYIYGHGNWTLTYIGLFGWLTFSIIRRILLDEWVFIPNQYRYSYFINIGFIAVILYGIFLYNYLMRNNIYIN